MLKRHEPAVWELFDLKVLDPAMGSGHFLVETVDYVTDRVLDFLAGFPWNPVQVLVDQRIRSQIIESLDQQGVKVNEDRLTDVNLIKRLVMKRCVYGVDLNPMAVELAKVSLWLDSFTLGAPLSFLDHHLKCGNSLVGSTIDDLKRSAAGWMYGIPLEPLERATRNMELIADLSDATLTEVTRSADTYKQVLTGVRGYRALLDCLTAEHFGVAGASSLVTHGSDLDLEHWEATVKALPARDRRWIDESGAISRSRSFFHWDVDFPDVFFAIRRPAELRRFDAVVGNPPYDELSEFAAGQELPEKEYLELRPLFEPAKGGRQNVFRYFVVRAVTVTRPGGTQSFIVPMALLSDEFTKNLRYWLRSRHFPRRIDALPQKDDPHRRVFFEAKLSTCVYVAGVERTSGSCEVATHPWNAIERSAPRYSLKSDSPVLRNQDAAIPVGIDQQEYEILERVAGSTRCALFADAGEFFPGELMLNASFRFLAEATKASSSTPEIVRGAHVARFQFLPNPRQGDAQFLDKNRYLEEVHGAKATHHGLSRLVYQRYAAIDNYRRLIGTILDPPTFCSHTTGYMLPRRYALQTCLALFNCAVSEWRFSITSTNNNVNSYELEALPIPRFQRLDQENTAPSRASGHHNGGEPEPINVSVQRLDDGASLAEIWQEVERQCETVPPTSSHWPDRIHDLLGAVAVASWELGTCRNKLEAEFTAALKKISDTSDLNDWTGASAFRDLDYLGWDCRYPDWEPDERAVAEGRRFANGVAPPLAGNGPGDIAWELIARVYPSYLLPEIDSAAWEAAAWDELVDLLRKNKTHLGSSRLRADLPLSGSVPHPTGPLRQLRDTFLGAHRQTRTNRARAAELDFLIDRIVFRLFDLTLDEQRLILSRVGPGRPLPPRRGRRKKNQSKEKAEGPMLF